MSKIIDNIMFKGESYEFADKEARERLDGVVTKEDLEYVTPQMFGAVGDGIADDTEAIQAAMDTGYPVEFDKNKQYFVSGFTIRSNINLKGNGATLLCTGKTAETGSAYCFYIPQTDDSMKLYDIKISNFNIVILNHIVGVFHGNQGKNLTIDSCSVEGNASLDPSINAIDSPGANQGFVFYNFEKFAITNNVINNIRAYAISVEEHNSNGIISGNKINNTGRGAIYVRAYNKNVEVTRNEIRNAVRCFTIVDGAIDLYGAGNENIYVNKNFITGYGRPERNAIGIRIKGSKNVVCSENTIVVDESTNSFALIFTQDRYEVRCENIIIEKNHLTVLAGVSTYIIRDDHEPDFDNNWTKGLIIRNNYMLSDSNINSIGISVRRSIEGLSIIGNYIEGSGKAIEFYQQDGHKRTDVLCDANRMNNTALLFYGVDKLKFINNSIASDAVDKILLKLLKCSDVYVDSNVLVNTMEEQVVTYSGCLNINITDTNIFKTSAGAIDLHSYTFVKNTSGNTELTFDSLKDSVVGVQVYGYTQQIIDEGIEISPNNLIEYTSANSEGDLTITMNSFTCTDSCIKRGLPANKDIANCIDSNGQGWIADYRDWANGVDWHYVEEHVFTGDENVRDYDVDTILVEWTSLRNDKKAISSIYRRSHQMFSNAFKSFSSDNIEVSVNVASDLGNSIAINGYNSYFTNAEGFKALCKSLFDAGTPIKILYALKVPYSTPIDSDELDAYKQISMSVGNNTVSNNKSLYSKIVYLLNDDYSTGVKNTITNEIDNFVTGTALKILTGIEPIEVQNNKTIIANDGTIKDRDKYSVSIYDVADFNANTISVTYSVSSSITSYPAFMVVDADGQIIDMVMCASSTVGVYTDTYNVPSGADKIYVNTRMSQTDDVSLWKNILQCLKYETKSKFKDGINKYTYDKEYIDKALANYITDVARLIGGDA